MFDALMTALAYGGTTAGLVLMIARAMYEAGSWCVPFIPAHGPDAGTPVDWADDPFAFEEVEKAVMRVLEAVRPDGEAVIPRHLSAAGMPPDFPQEVEFGSNIANSLLAVVAGKYPGSEKSQCGDALRPMLLHVIDRVKKASDEIRRPQPNRGKQCRAQLRAAEKHRGASNSMLAMTQAGNAKLAMSPCAANALTPNANWRDC